MFRRAFLGMACLAAVAGAEDAAPSFAPGRETEVDWFPRKRPPRVFVPLDYTAERAWPLLLFYRGTGGSPSTGLIRRYTQDRGFLVVGMEYGSEESKSLSATNIANEVRHIADLRERLGKSLHLDERTYIGGISLGGWMSDILARRGFPTFAGAMIMAAGKIPGDLEGILNVQAAERPRQAQAAPIYLGVGQTDGNWIYALRAIDEYRGRKHGVTFDEFLGRGHQGPGDSEALFQWLFIERHAGEATRLGPEAARWFEAKFAASAKVENPIYRYLFLERMNAAPLLRFVDGAKRGLLVRTLDQVNKHPAFRGEFEVRRNYQGLVNREKDFVRSGQLVPLMEQYHRLYALNKQSHFGQRAAMDVVRLRQNIRVLSSSATDGAEPAFRLPELPVPEKELQAAFAKLGGLLNSWRPPQEP